MCSVYPNVCLFPPSSESRQWRKLETSHTGFKSPRPRCVTDEPHTDLSVTRESHEVTQMLHGPLLLHYALIGISCVNGCERSVQLGDQRSLLICEGHFTGAEHPHSYHMCNHLRSGQAFCQMRFHCGQCTSSHGLTNFQGALLFLGRSLIFHQLFAVRFVVLFLSSLMQWCRHFTGEKKQYRETFLLLCSNDVKLT